MTVDLNILLKDELNKVEDILATTLTGTKQEEHVNNMCQFLVSAGGKRMRPKLALLSALAITSYDKTKHEHIACLIAAIVELLHTATLMHDDVIDKATTRRGVTTLNETEGNHVAVLAGDYMFTRCFDLSTRIENFDFLRFLNNTIATLVAGEIEQLKHEGFLDISLKDYYNIIYCKTGALFELSSAAFATTINAPETIIENLKEYGKNLGIAFQIVDDMLDYSSDSQTLGKNVGEDLVDQRITLPVIIALEQVDTNSKNELILAIEDANFEKVKSFILKTHSLDKCYELASNAVLAAKHNLDCLEDSPYKQSLITLLDMSLNRKA